VRAARFNTRSQAQEASGRIMEAAQALIQSPELSERRIQKVKSCFSDTCAR